MRFFPVVFALPLVFASFDLLPLGGWKEVAIAQSSPTETRSKESYNLELAYRTELKRLVDEGDVLLKQNKFKQAITIYQKALNLAKQNRDLEDQGMILWALGRVYDQDGQFLLAESSFIDGLKIIEEAAKTFVNSSKQLSQVRTRIYLHTGLGLVYQHIGEYDKASNYLKRAVGLSDNTPRDPQFLTLTHFEPRLRLGENYSQLRKYQQAIDLFTECRNLALQMGDREKEAIALTALGNSHGAMGNVKLAKVFYDQAKSLGNFPREPKISNSRETIEGALGEFSRIGEFFEKLVPALTKSSVAIRQLSKATSSDARFAVTGKLADTLDKMTGNMRGILHDLQQGNWLEALQNLRALQGDQYQFSQESNQLLSLINSIKKNPDEYRNLNQLSQEAMNSIKEVLRDLGALDSSLRSRRKEFDKSYDLGFIDLKKNNLKINQL
jgi:tetratricopeptide (TPR) repeat protein